MNDRVFPGEAGDWIIDGLEDLSPELREAWPAMAGPSPRDDWLPRLTSVASAAAALPTAVDWRARGVVPRARDQGRGNTCTSFAICAALEALHLIQRRPAIRLAPGYIHTCLFGLGQEEPCDLGYAVEAVAASGVAYGFPGDYPYPGAFCSTGNLFAVQRRRAVSGAAAAKTALATIGPLVAEMWIYPDFIGFRGSGAYAHDHAGATQLHNVCVVGYDDGLGAWIILNSHGPAWGRGDGTGYVAYGTGELVTESRQAYQLFV